MGFSNSPYTFRGIKKRVQMRVGRQELRVVSTLQGFVKYGLVLRSAQN